MIEEKLVGRLETSEDRKKLRWLGPPIFLAFVLLGTAIDAANGVLTNKGPGVGVVAGVVVAVSVVDYMTSVRVKRHLGASLDENYQDSGLIGRWFITLLSGAIMSGIVTALLLVPVGLLFLLLAEMGFWSVGALDGGIDAISISTFVVIGLVTVWFLASISLDKNEWESTSEQSVQTDREKDSDSGSQTTDADTDTSLDSVDTIDSSHDHARSIGWKIPKIKDQIEQNHFDTARTNLDQIESKLSEVESHTTRTELADEIRDQRTEILQAEARAHESEVEDAIEAGSVAQGEAALEALDETLEALAGRDSAVVEPRRAERDDLAERLESLREQEHEAKAKKRVVGMLGSLGSARSQIEDSIADGEYEHARKRAKSALETTTEAEQLSERYGLGYGERLDEIGSELEQYKQEAESKQSEAEEAHTQYEIARDALNEGDVEQARDAWNTIETPVAETLNAPGRTDTIATALRERAERRCEELQSEAKRKQSVAQSLLDDSDYETARERANSGIETCQDIETLQQTFDIKAASIDDLQASLVNLQEEATEAQSLLDDVDEQQQAVKRALESRAYGTAEDVLTELERRIEELERSPAADDVVAEYQREANELEREVAKKRADARVTGLIGTAMSSHSKAVELVAEGERERATRRLESARESLEEAMALSDDYALGRAASIGEKLETVDELLDEAARQPRVELAEQLEAAEAAVERGIDARDAEDYEAAVEAFADAHETYRSAHDHATEYGLDAAWEIEQRESMVGEYRDVVESELEDQRQTVRGGLESLLDTAETALVRAEQYHEVDDAVSARESLDQVVETLDDAAQLVETGLATTSQEKRYDDFDTRAHTLMAELPEEVDGEYRDRDLIDALQRLAVKLDESPRPEFVNKYGDYPADAYLESFGSWTDALAAANLDPIDESARERRKYSRVEVLDAVVDVIDELGHQPSRTEMNRLGGVSSTTVANRFADWETGLELAENVEQNNATGERRETTKQNRDTRAETTGDDNDESKDRDADGNDDDLEGDDILDQIENELSRLE